MPHDTVSRVSWALTGAWRPPWWLKPVPSSVAGMSHAWQLSTWPVHTEMCRKPETHTASQRHNIKGGGWGECKQSHELSMSIPC